MITTSTIVIDVTAHPWLNSYDAGELARYADQALIEAQPGDVVQLFVGLLEPAHVIESFAWVRGDLIYNVIGPSNQVNRAWLQMLHAAELANAPWADA